MILERFFDENLAQTSYLIGCSATGEALVVDPNRDSEQYVDAAAARGLRVNHVTETHVHADFVSGVRRLAEVTGATLYLSAEGGEDWQYEFAASDGAVLLRHGDSFRVGEVEIGALHTPGHTPEHLSFLITDRSAADRPIAVLTGDFVFVGDVGRPDLLEKAARLEGTMEESARALFRSLQAFKRLPDYLQVLPGHGAGSACGKGISSVPSSTVGYERMFNWALAIDDEDEFVSAVLQGQPEPPKYFAEMKRINKQGPPTSGIGGAPPLLDDERLEALLAAGATVVDTRSAAAYAAGHVPGTLSIPLNRSFNTWAGWLLPYDAEIYLIVEESCPRCAGDAARELSLIGMDRVEGYFGSAAVERWAAAGNPLGSVPGITDAELAGQLPDGRIKVVDVRGRAEWEAGHLPGAENIPVGYIADHLDRIPRDRPVVVHCQGGARSAIAAGLLRSRGFGNVSDFSAGYAGWADAGHPTERADASGSTIN